MSVYSNQADQLADELFEKQKGEVEFFKEEQESTIPVKSKDSPELLNLRRILDSMVKQQKYLIIFLIRF